MAQSFLKVLTPQKSTTNHASSSTNAQATTLDPLSCAFCGQTSHFIAQYLVCADYITNEKCKRNPEGKIVLPNGQYTPQSIPGRFIKDRIDEWHKCNPIKSTSSSLMYEINPVAMSSQTSVSTNMVSTSSTNVFTADQCIAVLEQEIFNLRNAKRTFDGVEILKPARASNPKRCGVSGSCEKTLIERKLKIVASRRGRNLLCGLSKSGNKLVVICNYVWLN
jgi:hypothetical protein